MDQSQILLYIVRVILAAKHAGDFSPISKDHKHILRLRIRICVVRVSVQGSVDFFFQFVWYPVFLFLEIWFSTVPYLYVLMVQCGGGCFSFLVPTSCLSTSLPLLFCLTLQPLLFCLTLQMSPSLASLDGFVAALCWSALFYL